MFKCHGYHTKSGNAVSYVRFTEGFASQQFPRNDILRVLRVSVKSIGVKVIFQAGWQELRGSTGGTRRKVWTQTKILSPNIRYFVAN